MFRISGECFHNALVWTHENRISSDANTKEVCLPWLPQGALEPIGRLVKVDGKTRLNGVFKYDPFMPGTIVTQDGFDQVVLYHTLQSVSMRLIDMGFDISKVITSRRGAGFKITGHANATTALNAWYSPQNGEMTFGTNNGKWHLASDSDVSAHELGHLILDHYNPNLTGWFSKEGGAIHEGFGDAVAALYFDDPEVSEDFVPNKGKPESKEEGLRTVNNDLTLKDVGSGVHDRGRVYGGFWWSIKKILSNPNGPFRLSSREAADVTLRILINHSTHYFTKSPEPKDFVEAVLGGIESLARDGRLGVDKQMMWNVIINESKKRGLLMPDDKPAPEAIFGSIAELNAYIASFGADVRLYMAHEADFIGGRTETYQLQVRSSKFGYIDMIGKGVIIRKDNTGRIVVASARDFRPLKTDYIDDTGVVEIDDALNHAIQRAQIELLNAASNLGKLRQLGHRAPIQKLAEAEMGEEIAKTDLVNLRKMIQAVRSGRKPEHKIVLIDRSNVPHYEFKVGLSIYYVNTKTGEVTRYKDVIAN